MVPVESLMRRKLFLNLSQDFSFNLFYQHFFFQVIKASSLYGRPKLLKEKLSTKN